MSNNTGKFFLAGIFGAMAGAVGGLLLAPKSGKETRETIAKIALQISKDIKVESEETKERVKDVFGKANDEANQKYKEIRSAVIAKVAAVKTAGETLDKEKYAKVVDDVVGEFKKDFGNSKDGAVKLAKYFKKDWEKMKKAIA